VRMPLRVDTWRVLKWLREYDCPWDADTFVQATAAGHDDVVQWALDNGCPS